MQIQEAIRAVTAHKHLSIAEARDVFEQIMSGQATDAQIAAFIVGLKMKGETVEEITGAAEIMRDKATRISPACRDHLVDTCGTGGDGSCTFNISTAAAFIAAGAGARVAKHGNRSVSSKCGSADVLEALGVSIAAKPETVTRCLNEAGIAFLFAPALHGAMKYAIGPRREIAVRTIFNILGPLTNPAFAQAQLLGVFSAELTEIMATVLKNMGSEKVYVVHSADGLDEISLSAETKVTELSGGAITTYQVTPEQFGMKREPLEKIKGGSAQDNAAIINDILSGKKGPYRNIALLNAAFALAASGIAPTPQQGLTKAVESIESGAARKKVALLITLTKTES